MKQNDYKVAVVMPALNEEKSIGLVLNHIPTKFKQCIIVADNGSSDKTSEVALAYGAIVTTANQQGYGSACLAGIQKALEYRPDIIVFLDADYSDFPEDMTEIVEYLIDNNLDLVIGSRNLGQAEKGSILPQAIFGNWLATNLMYLRYRYKFSDLGPFRAIRASSLERLNMQDTNFGWTVEMQIKALKYKLQVGEVDVRYRKRIGISKITGTIKGSFKAGVKILWTIFLYR